MKKLILFVLILLSFNAVSICQNLDTVSLNIAILTENEKAQLKSELILMNDLDQKYRLLSDTVIAKYGKDSKENEENSRLWHVTDSLNIIKLENLVSRFGYENIIDIDAGAFFIIIQHASLQKQLKYIPCFKESAKKGKMSGQNIALMEDRINIRTGKKQVYGTQICKNPETEEQYVCPLEDPDNVDKRRSEIGFPKGFILLGDYTKYFGFEWKLEEYKKRLPEFEAIEKAKGNW